MTTVKKIAELANVSIGTVDRVIHNRGRVSVKTKERIEQIIAELGYKPNFFAKNLRRSKIFSFAVLIPKPEQDHNFWRLFIPGIERARKELESYNVRLSIYHYDRLSGQSFENESWKMMQSEHDGFIIAPVLMPEIENFVRNIPIDIPYVFFDSPIENSNCLLHIGHNSYQSGQLGGKLIKLLMGEQDGSIAIFRSFHRMIHMADRVKGFIDFFGKKYESRIKVYDIRGNETEDHYNTLTNQAFAESPDLKCIFITNAYAHGVAGYLKKSKLKNKVSLVGYDLVPENIRLMNEGYIDFLISLRPELQAYRAMMALYYHVVQNRKLEGEVKIPIDILTKENIEYYNF
ncbi:MAG: substrate-binding domain-containing protein [Bacteroidales bacterium]|nr:substrate-binding domain-containing protein [Bacteroidales bacterium]